MKKINWQGRMLVLAFAAVGGGCGVTMPHQSARVQQENVQSVPPQRMTTEVSPRGQEFYESLVKAFRYTRVENSYHQENKRRAQISEGMLYSVKQRNHMAVEACKIVNMPELSQEMQKLRDGYRGLLRLMLTEGFVRGEDARFKLERFEQQVAYTSTNHVDTVRECLSLRR